jgi:hypothetical protein
MDENIKEFFVFIFTSNYFRNTSTRNSEALTVEPQSEAQKWALLIRLTEIDIFMTCVKVSLPSLGMILDKQELRLTRN